MLGQAYITWPLIDEGFRTIDKFKVVAERLNIAGEQIKKAGLELAYHNHDFEFVDQNGQRATTSSSRKRTRRWSSCRWISTGSRTAEAESPHELFERAPGRFVMWHVKDMHKVSRDYTELGNGSIDFTRIWPDASLAGLKHYFVEQGGNFTHDPMRSVADSAEYVKRVR